MYPNNKPRITKDLRCVNNKKKKTFYTGNPYELKTVSREVKNAIVKAKMNYRRKVETQYSNSDLRAAWHGIKCMSSINQSPYETKQLIRVEGVTSVTPC